MAYLNSVVVAVAAREKKCCRAIFFGPRKLPERKRRKHLRSRQKNLLEIRAFKILSRQAFVWIEPFLPFSLCLGMCVRYGHYIFLSLSAKFRFGGGPLTSISQIHLQLRSKKGFYSVHYPPPHPQRWSIAPLNFQRLDGKGREKGQFLGFFETSVSPKMGLVAAFFFWAWRKSWKAS